MIPDACKEPLLGMYYLATLPARRQAAARRAATGESPITALFYHRVADEHPNDWTITTERFKAQIEWVRERFEIISLVEAQQRLGGGNSCEPAVCITFDDGYSDNCREAIPWLLDEKIRLTYFVATRHIMEGRPFDHDVKSGCPLAPNTVEEIRVMAEAGVEIGAHTRTHADLGQASEDDLHEEIVGSKRDLEAITRNAVRYFAFPFGLPANLSEAAFRTAFRAGFWGVCSAYGGYNQPGDDAFHLQRIHGDPSWARFCNSLTIDPRKLDRVSQFDPGDYRLCF
ncbi:polysaccharide deacetylase family protein [Pirellulales bacterium]|nr:polysaccharide deacetylase family protein [Pirellulales bacterium]